MVGDVVRAVTVWSTDHQEYHRTFDFGTESEERMLEQWGITCSNSHFNRLFLAAPLSTDQRGQGQRKGHVLGSICNGPSEREWWPGTTW